jgi:microcystin-dependent protein
MGLEVANYVSDLVTTNPAASDGKSQGDDHLRLLKSVLQTTFPNAGKAFYFPTTEEKTDSFSIAVEDLNKTFLVDASGVTSALTATLPTLASGDAGWSCGFLKTDTSTKPILIAPASGTLQSGDIAGLAKTRRCIPGRRFEAYWTGASWIISRCANEPVGAVIEHSLAALPVGYEWASGATLSSASTYYPDYYSKKGSGVLVDRRGRVAAGKDNMGGSAAGRLTDQSGGVDGDTLGAGGGEERHTLTTAELASHTHTATVTDPKHTHDVTSYGGSGGSDNVVSGTDAAGSPRTSASAAKAASTGITVSNANAGSNTPHNNVQPTIIENFIVVVE